MDRKEVARLIRVHYYDPEDATCACISSNAAPRAHITHMSIVEHSEHVAGLVVCVNYTPRLLDGHAGERRSYHDLLSLDNY